MSRDVQRSPIARSNDEAEVSVGFRYMFQDVGGPPIRAALLNTVVALYLGYPGLE